MGLSARRGRGRPGPARPPHDARTWPGRCRPHQATTRPRAAGSAGPSRPARPSCRTLLGRRPVPRPVPGPHRAVRSAAAGARIPDAAQARAVWWTARHPVRPQPSVRPPPAAQSPLTCTLTASSDPGTAAETATGIDARNLCRFASHTVYPRLRAVPRRRRPGHSPAGRRNSERLARCRFPRPSSCGRRARRRSRRSGCRTGLAGPAGSRAARCPRAGVRRGGSNRIARCRG